MKNSLKAAAVLAVSVAGLGAWMGAPVPTSAGYVDSEKATATAVTAPPGAYTPTDLNRSTMVGGALAGGSVYVWGSLGGGIAGNGKWNTSTDGPSDPSVVRVDLPLTSDPATTAPIKVKQLALNSSLYETDEYKVGTTAVALSENGDVYSWGSNVYAKLGIGSTDNSLICNRGVNVANCSNGPLLTGVKKIGASNNAFYALTTNGDLYGWGSGWFQGSAAGPGAWTGEFGMVSGAPIRTLSKPTLLKSGVADFFSVLYGHFDLSTSKTLTYSGMGSPSQGIELDSGTPVFGKPQYNFLVPGVMAAVGTDELVDIQTSPNTGLALTSTGRVLTWGSKGNLLLGLSQATQDYTTPRVLSIGGGKVIKDIAIGTSQALALAQDGSVWGWGIFYSAFGVTDNKYVVQYANTPGPLNNPYNPDSLTIGTDNQAIASMPYTVFLTKNDYSLVGWGSGGDARGSLLPGATVKWNGTVGVQKYIAPFTKLTLPGIR